MKTFIGVTTFLFVLIAAPGMAADVGRYQAVPMDGDGPGRSSGRVLIIDTQEGHVWTWSGNELLGDGSSGRRYGSAFVYQGKVRPGNKTGEVLDLPAK